MPRRINASPRKFREALNHSERPLKHLDCPEPHQGSYIKLRGIGLAIIAGELGRATTGNWKRLLSSAGRRNILPVMLPRLERIRQEVRGIRADCNQGCAPQIQEAWGGRPELVNP